MALSKVLDIYHAPIAHGLILRLISSLPDRRAERGKLSGGVNSLGLSLRPVSCNLNALDYDQPSPRSKRLQDFAMRIKDKYNPIKTCCLIF